MIGNMRAELVERLRAVVCVLCLAARALSKRARDGAVDRVVLHEQDAPAAQRCHGTFHSPSLRNVVGLPFLRVLSRFYCNRYLQNIN